MLLRRAVPVLIVIFLTIVGFARWLQLAERYPQMPEEKQQRVQRRMRDWASLTPQQREEARERYRRLRDLPPDEREKLMERWREYQNLPEHRRQELRDQHRYRDRQDQ